jgi:ElaB/YqjD/DUF883 family membrane-anchored ribosome-binding protein
MKLFSAAPQLREDKDKDKENGHDHGLALAAAKQARTREKVCSTVNDSRVELESLAVVVNRTIGSAATAFQELIQHTDTILELAAAVIACVESESVSSVLPKVQTLGEAARSFITERLGATQGVLETATAEVTLLHQLLGVAESQESIALEIKALSVLTNIEVARLGSVGTGFQYLANELSEFSKSVLDDTHMLANHTADRRTAIEATRSLLLAEMPRLREELTRIEVDLGSALAVVDSSLTSLSQTPLQFKSSVEEIASLITAVISAIQGNDITRQMDEHVQQAFRLIAARMHGGEEENAIDEELPQSYAGLIIQVAQMKTVQNSVTHWISQIRSCLSGIVGVSTSALLGIGPMVLEQEQTVSSQLARIALLEQSGEAYLKRIRDTLGGLSNLMQLVSEHLQRSKSIRDRLRLLAFNSIIEASHLGTQADAILAISKSIKEISASWSQITVHSEQVMQEILKLVEQTNQVMEAFSPASNERLREAQSQTASGLENLRSAAECTDQLAHKMKAAMEKMQAKISEIGKGSDLLDACVGRGQAVLAAIEGLTRRLEDEHPGVQRRYDAAAAEKLYAASYTMELEREVLRAALDGKPLPMIQATFSGNSAELF